MEAAIGPRVTPGTLSSADEPLERRAVRRALAPHRQSAEQDVRRLLDVGLRLMVAAGSQHQPRLTDIIRAAGLSNDAFYRYFAGKDELVAAIVDDGSRRLLSHVRHQLAKSSEPVDQLHLGMEAVIKQAADPVIAATTRAVLRNASTPRAAGSTFGAQLTAELAAIFAGPLRTLGTPDSDRDSRALAVTVFATMEHFLWNEEVPSEADIDHLFQFLLRGVGTPGARRVAR